MSHANEFAGSTGSRAPHLISFVAAVFLVGTALVVGKTIAERVENRYVHALAPQQFLLKNLGSALQREAFRQADLLPLYGSSELQTLDDPYHASNLFQKYPTGFTVFTVGDIGTTTLLMVQAMAAIGPGLRGKKVVFSLTPTWFYQLDDFADEYAGNFSPLHASATLFGGLSSGLKTQLARRMLHYPKTLENQPLLKLAVHELAADSRVGRSIYVVLWPLGQLQNWVLGLQDHWHSTSYIRQQTLEPSLQRETASLDWPALLVQSERAFQAHNNNNPFGFDNKWYEKRFERTIAKNRHTDATFRAGLAKSTEWIDLELLLRVATELGAQPLILCAPSPGRFFEYLHISSEPRRTYYQKFDSVMKAHGVPVLSFADHDADTTFILDPAAHMSEKGWVYFDQALDAFYHGTLK